MCAWACSGVKAAVFDSGDSISVTLKFINRVNLAYKKFYLSQLRNIYKVNEALTLVEPSFMFIPKRRSKTIEEYEKIKGFVQSAEYFTRLT